jgi:hypothetical protein
MKLKIQRPPSLSTNPAPHVIHNLAIKPKVFISYPRPRSRRVSVHTISFAAQKHKCAISNRTPFCNGMVLSVTLG